MPNFFSSKFLLFHFKVFASNSKVKSHSFYFLRIQRVLKKIGGHWAKRQVDGDKYICLDNLLAGGSCLIYSFGISKDWTFEDMLDSAGLKMRNLS